MAVAADSCLEYSVNKFHIVGGLSGHCQAVPQVNLRKQIPCLFCGADASGLTCELLDGPGFRIHDPVYLCGDRCCNPHFEQLA